jgi:hypothetical protein
MLKNILTRSSPYLVYAAILLCGVVLLSACETSYHADGAPQPKITFSHLQAIPLSVGMLNTEDAKDAFITESFVVSPYAALREYLPTRFRPNGFNGSLKATIEDASIRHRFETSDEKFNKMLNVGGIDTYDMTILLRLEHIGNDKNLKYGTILTVRRVVRVSEHASIVERERAQLRTMDALFSDLDREILRVVLSDMKLGL